MELSLANLPMQISKFYTVLISHIPFSYLGVLIFKGKTKSYQMNNGLVFVELGFSEEKISLLMMSDRQFGMVSRFRLRRFKTISSVFTDNIVPWSISNKQHKCLLFTKSVHQKRE